MRVNVYAEELTDRVELISKEIEGHTYTAIRFYLELPCTSQNGVQLRGPFIHRPGDDDSAAVTFWGKRDMRPLLRKALQLLDEHYSTRRKWRDAPDPAAPTAPGLAAAQKRVLKAAKAFSEACRSVFSADQIDSRIIHELHDANRELDKFAADSPESRPIDPAAATSPAPAVPDYAKCPKCGGHVSLSHHGAYCPKPECKWGWEIEMDGSPLKPPIAPAAAMFPALSAAVDRVQLHLSTPAGTVGGAFEWLETLDRELVRLRELIDNYTKK